ncbi:hypothetical protein M8J75_005411 [Diaphorina citri]|nr:hypothetical protein M8J75_005411 [Diaphorina citri]
MTTSLGDVFDETEDGPILKSCKGVIARHLPKDWRTWKIKVEGLNLPIRDALRNKIRFAIPSLELFKAVLPKEDQISEKSYRKVYAALLECPLGRALICSPSEVVNAIQEDVEGFLNKVEPIKDLLLSRSELNNSLRSLIRTECSPEPESPLFSPHPSPRLSQAHHHRSRDLPQRVGALEGRLDSIQETLAKISNSLDRRSTSRRSPSYDSWEASGEDARGEESDCSEFSAQEQPLEEAVIGRQLWNSAPSDPTLDSFLDPSTAVKEPELADPDPDLARQAIHCQRLGQPGWCGVRYAEAEKRLKRGGVFQPLVTNNMFASQMPDASLRRQERLLGTLTYGLLSQRKAFGEAQSALLKRFPEAKQYFNTVFMEDNGFRSITDDLLQLVCGKRAEVIADRRKLVEAGDQVSTRSLQEIPPSASHLFDEERTSKWGADPHVKCRKGRKRPMEHTSYSSSVKRPRQSAQRNGGRDVSRGFRRDRAPPGNRGKKVLEGGRTKSASTKQFPERRQTKHRGGQRTV